VLILERDRPIARIVPLEDTELADDERRADHERKGVLRVARHALRAGEAIQPASATVAAEGGAGPLEFVCFDTRLALVAATEGLRVVPEPSR
jgi:antitoxin (DNA-binding transcriptional repressor) of toxin-antitoxin stability system